jgi:hypothetical protein
MKSQGLESQTNQWLNYVQYDLFVIYSALLQIVSDRQLRFSISETWMALVKNGFEGFR